MDDQLHADQEIDLRDRIVVDHGDDLEAVLGKRRRGQGKKSGHQGKDEKDWSAHDPGRS